MTDLAAIMVEPRVLYDKPRPKGDIAAQIDRLLNVVLREGVDREQALWPLIYEYGAALALLADTPSVEPDVEFVRLTMIDGIGTELSREFAQGSPFEPFDRLYVVQTITKVLDAARDRTRKAKP